MQCINNTVRRQDRLMDERRAMQLLRTAEYGVLSMVSEGSGYGIPVNFVFDGDHSIYIHCAPEGRKLRAIKENKNVSLCIIGHVNLLPDKFTTEYESAIFFGEAHIGLSENERTHALQLFISKMSPDYKETGEMYARKSFHRTEIIRVDIATFSGKCKRMHSAG